MVLFRWSYNTYTVLMYVSVDCVQSMETTPSIDWRTELDVLVYLYLPCESQTGAGNVS